MADPGSLQVDSDGARATSADTTDAADAAGGRIGWPRRLAIIAIALSINSAVYLVINAFPPREPRLLPRGALDDWLEWQAWTIWPYWLLLLAGPAMMLAIDRRRLLFATLRAYALAIALNAAVWLLWPTRIARPPLPRGLDAFTEAAWRVLYTLDGVNNCFPSGHITIPAVAAVGFAARFPRARIALAAALAALAPSVVSTGQHYAWDVAGGLATATIGLLLAGGPLWRRGRR